MTRGLVRKSSPLTLTVLAALLVTSAPAVAADANPVGSAGRTVYVATSGRDTAGGTGPHIISLHTIGADSA
jgi:hypothetical protein